MKVQLFIPCFIDQMFPETGANTKLILEKAGCEVLYNQAQTCCGQPAYNAGYWDEAKEVASKFLDDFFLKVPIVLPSASCAGMIRNGYDSLFENSVSYYLKSKSIAENTYELSDFLVNVLKKEYFGAELEGKAVYHDSCSALRDCKIKEEPRILLSHVMGLELLEVSDEEVCCGFGGSFAVKFPDISSAMAEQKVINAFASGADYIISTDASCLMHLQSYIDKQQLPMQTLHLADVLASGWAFV